jgi:hypothetical protein
LLDHNLPRALRQLLQPHDVFTTRYKGWDRLQNGLLLRTAADDGFDLLITLDDKAMEYEQNLSRLRIPIVQADAGSTKIEAIRPFVPAVLTLLATPLVPALYIVAADGTVTRITAPRSKP